MVCKSSLFLSWLLHKNIKVKMRIYVTRENSTLPGRFQHHAHQIRRKRQTLIYLAHKYMTAHLALIKRKRSRGLCYIYEPKYYGIWSSYIHWNTKYQSYWCIINDDCSYLDFHHLQIIIASKDLKICHIVKTAPTSIRKLILGFDCM